MLSSKAAGEVQIRRNEDFNGPDQEGRRVLSGHPVLAGWQRGRAMFGWRPPICIR
jgi:hypothetical protein